MKGNVFELIKRPGYTGLRFLKRNVISFDRRESSLTVRVLRTDVFEYYDHLILSFSRDLIGSIEPKTDITYQKITRENLEDCRKADFSFERMEEYLSTQSKFVDGYVFYINGDTPVGCLWVMYKGGNEYQYRIRTIDAYGFDFCVYDEYRGQGLIGYMISCAMRELQKKQIEKLYVGVRTNNASALKAYRKIGAEEEGRKRFAFVFGRRIPYRIL